MRKKLLLLFLTIVSVACLAFGVTACGGNSGSSTKGTYYLYKNGSYDYTNYITLSGSSWEDDDGESGTYKISGTSITFYYELLGETEELMDGTISDGVMTLNIMGATYTYCLDGKTPSSSGTDDGGTSTTYTVTYNANGGAFADGSGTYTQTVNSGSTLTAPASPTRDGCTFAGWATSKNGSTMWQFGSDKVTRNTTLYASWSEQSASILSVDGASIDGTEISMLVDHNTDSVSLSTKVVCSSDSTWKLYYDKLGQTEIPTKIAASTAGSLYNGDNVFYIVVTSTDGTQVNVYTLTIYRSYAVYVTYYDGTTAIKTETAYTGYSFTTTYTPDISGYTFNYWKASSGNKFTETTLTSALSLYADKTANDYTITYDVNGGDELATTTKTVTYNSSYTLAVPTRTGYTFSGWYYGSTQLTDGEGKSIDVWSHASDTTVKAKWTANDYTVTLNLSNSSAGTVTGDGDHAYDSSVTIEAINNDGYTFVGWYDKNGELVSTNASFTFTMGFDVSYTAKWTYYTFTTHVSDSAAGSVSNYLNVAVKVTVGTSITITATTNSGYTFVGWFNEDDELVTSDLSYTFKMPVEDLEYTAKWCRVIVAANDEAAGAVTSLGSTYKTGDKVTVKATANLGYSVVGWYDSNDELLTSDSSYTITMPNEDITYTAKFELNSEMSNFKFTSTATTCSITGLNDKTVTEIVVPDYVTTISSGAFSGCSSLVSIALPFVGGSVKTSSETYQYPFGYIFGTSNYTGGTSTYQVYYGSSTSSTTNSTYYIPTTLSSVTITSGRLPYGAFYNCTKLTSITISNVTNIGAYAFYKCTAIKSVTIPDSVTFIGTYAFSGCSAEIEWGDNPAITTINSYAFANYAGTSITIPDNVTSINEYAFYNCVALTDIIVPDSVTSISNDVFSGCSNLVSITLPFVGNSIRTSSSSWQYPLGFIFGTTSYTGGTATTQYFYGSSTSSSTNYTYYIPTTLTTVTITGGNILYGAFYNCKNLKSITLGDGITSIGNAAFRYCSSLESITIPNSVTSTSNFAFDGCTSLTSVYYSGTASQWASISFGDYYVGNPLYYAGNLYFDGTLATDVKIEGITTINAYSFYGCTSLTNVTIDDSVTSIGSYAFSNCTSLESVIV